MQKINNAEIIYIFVFALTSDIEVSILKISLQQIGIEITYITITF